MTELVKRSSSCWKAKVRNLYSSVEELQAYEETYRVVSRCGYFSAQTLWDDNPLIMGSVYPEYFGLADSTHHKRGKKMLLLV